ncbi:MAG: DEAD/DEAH box helicase [Proteobacteria bacterium]|nr:DEAD/DEAH box helicase [Pseudomonadota bacterium]
MNFSTPTPIQAQAIPLALEGKDVLGSAQTGTGKTGAFGIPLVAKLLASPRGSAMVLTPTRELAVQVLEAITKMLGKPTSIKTALIIGGDSMPKQLQQLRMRPRVIVGTPGRINDHLARGTLMLHDTNYLVLDETDRMLDMGFGVQLEKIVKYLPKQRQTMMFSATLPHNIMKLAEKYLTNPTRIAVGSNNTPIANINQEVIHVSSAGKFDELLNQIEKREGSIIIFVKTKWGAEKMADKLRKQGHSADAIHGDLRQNQRDRVIQAFRGKKHRIMVATDIAARGLDIPHIEHVINYDLPQAPEDYIHRIGRTARAGAEGAAVNLVSGEDGLKWRAIQRLINPNAKPEPVKHENSHRARGGYGQGGGNRQRGNNTHRGQGGQRHERNDRQEHSKPVEQTAPEQAVSEQAASEHAPRAERTEHVEQRTPRHEQRAERSEQRSEHRSERRNDEGREHRRDRSERKPRHPNGRNGDRNNRGYGERTFEGRSERGERGENRGEGRGERQFGDRKFAGDHKKRDFRGERDGNREQGGNRDRDHKKRDFQGERDGNRQYGNREDRAQGERGDRKFEGRSNRDHRDGNGGNDRPGGGKPRGRHNGGKGSHFGGPKRDTRSAGNDNRSNRGDKPKTRNHFTNSDDDKSAA